MAEFKVVSDFDLMGDQPEAVDTLAKGILDGKRAQTLMGVTGSGKTFTMAKLIERVQKPTLVISHNKTLAAQLHGEFKEFFPENAVEYFVSYYDYYQPEAYVASTDTYIEKDSDINAEIEKLRHSATAALSERRDVIIVASVSCIYGLGSPIDYENQVISLRPGMEKDRQELLRKLVDIQIPETIWRWNGATSRARRYGGYLSGRSGECGADRIVWRRSGDDQGNQPGHRRNRRDPKSCGYISGIPLCYQQG